MTRNQERHFIVLRPGPGLPAGSMLPRLNGFWVDITGCDEWAGRRVKSMVVGGNNATRTGTYEVREDGQRAEVWEVTEPMELTDEELADLAVAR